MNNFQDWYGQLTKNSNDVIKECRRWSWLLKKSYNKNGSLRSVPNDQDAYLVGLIDRGVTQRLACWLMPTTMKCFSDTTHIDNIKFSILNPGVSTTNLTLFADNVTRFIIPLDCDDQSGHIIDGVDYKYSSNPLIKISNKDSIFSGYNSGTTPRLILVVNIINS